MTSEWRTEPLNDVISYIAKGIPPAYVEVEGENTVRVLNQKCNRDFAISYAESRLHDLNKRNVPQEKYLRDGDILINSTGTGTAGRIAQLNTVPFPTIVDGHMIILRGNEKVKPLYLGYALKAQQATVLQLDEGSTGQTELNRDRLLAEIEVSYPVSLDEQDAIVSVLSALDDQIITNKRINHHLEQIAQAIFKSWFVDFEPFGGMMPDDWREGTISDLGDVIGGSTPSKAKPEYYAEHGIAWITPKDLSVNKNKFIAHGADDITELGIRNSSARLMPRGTVLFSSRAPIGYIAIARGEVCTNQGFKSVVPKANVGTAFIYYFLIENLQIIEGMASGSTFKEVSGSTMKGIPAIVPDDDTLRRFQEECTPIFEKQELLEAENAHLAEIRDALLPRLMSGELSVADLSR